MFPNNTFPKSRASKITLTGNNMIADKTSRLGVQGPDRKYFPQNHRERVATKLYIRREITFLFQIALLKSIAFKTV